MISKEPEGECIQGGLEIRIEFQVCSHNTSTQMFEDVQNMNRGENAMDSACQALKDLSEECYAYIVDCFLVEDHIDTPKLHIAKIIKFILKFGEGKITEDTVSKCEAVKEIMDDLASVEGMDEKRQRLQKVSKLFEREATNYAMFSNPLVWLVMFVVLINDNVLL